MRNFQVRSDGPPDYEWFGSFDGFQTEFSISQLVEEKFTSTNTGSPKCAPENMEVDELARQYNRCKCGGELVVAEWQCTECNTFIGNP